MAQFMVCRNKNPQTRSAVPFLLDVQNDLLDNLETRSWFLCPIATMKEPRLRTLTPVLEIEGERIDMLTPQMAGIPKSELGAPVTRASSTGSRSSPPLTSS
jgi:toxin CcdB